MNNLDGSFINQAIILFIKGYNIKGNNYTFNDFVDLLITSNSSHIDEVKKFTRTVKQLKAYELDKIMDMNIGQDCYGDTYITFCIHLDDEQVICRSICFDVDNDNLYATIITRLTERFNCIVKTYEEYIDEFDWGKYIKSNPDLYNYCLTEKIKAINKEFETIRTEAIMALIKNITTKEK